MHRVPDKEKTYSERVFEKIITKKSPNLMKTIYTYQKLDDLQEA